MPRTTRRRATAAAVLGAAAAVAAASLAVPAAASPHVAAAAAATTAPALPPIGHVWVVVLENKSYAQSFSPVTTAPYLRTLAAKGALVPQYYGVAHFSLPNYIALMSGQGPNVVTQSDCQTYSDFRTTGTAVSDGQLPGQGCVYPTGTPMLADELERAGRSWHGYLEDLGRSTTRQQGPCGTPVTDALGRDQSQSATATDQYAARHNPFVYFHSVTDAPARCTAHLSPLTSLETDLRSAATTPAFNVLVPNLCDDGHDTGCAGPDVAGDKTGNLTAVQHWLTRYVPPILASPAFQRDGMLVVTWDEAAATNGADGSADASACCQETALNTPDPGGASSDISGLTATSGPGGGRVGAIVLSPYVRPGTVSSVAYNHYSMLRTFSDLFHVARPGYAAQAAGVVDLGPDVFTNPAGPAAAKARKPARRPVHRATKKKKRSHRSSRHARRLPRTG